MAADAEPGPDEPRRDMPTVGRVAALYVAARAGEAMTSQESVRLMAGFGIVGDRYSSGTGHWSDPRWPDQQVTLVEEEVAEELGLSPALLRRNIVTRGLRLTQLIGARFKVGDVEFVGVRVCDPCAYLERLVGRAGLARDLGRAGPGLRAEVRSRGYLAVGDRVVEA